MIPHGSTRPCWQVCVIHDSRGRESILGDGSIREQGGVECFLTADLKKEGNDGPTLF
jgi:hypothetical protein